MSEIDHIINTQIIKFRENWPKLTEGQRDMYTRLFREMKSGIIPLVADHLLNHCDYPPKQKDVRKAENMFLVDVGEKQSQALTSTNDLDNG